MNIHLSFRMKVCSLHSHLTWSVAAVMLTVSIEIKVLFSYMLIYFYSSYTRLVFIFYRILLRERKKRYDLCRDCHDEPGSTRNKRNSEKTMNGASRMKRFREKKKMQRRREQHVGILFINSCTCHDNRTFMNSYLLTTHPIYS